MNGKLFKLVALIGSMGLILGACNKRGSENNQMAEKEETEKTVNVNELPKEVFLPQDYRHWTHVKTLILQEGHPLYESFGGIHHIYANDEAMKGYQTGTFPDGSVIVFDLLEVDQQENALGEGKRKVIGIMYKNSQVFTETGGWGFGAFANLQGERVNIDGKSQCFSCHASQKEHDYVFSTYRE